MDASLGCVEQLVVAVDVVGEFAGDLLALAAHRVGGFEAVDDRVDPVHGGDPEPGTTRNHLEEQRMQPAACFVLQPTQLAVSLRQQLQHPAMIRKARCLDAQR